jgi:hypothetical protein
MTALTGGLAPIGGRAIGSPAAWSVHIWKPRLLDENLRYDLTRGLPGTNWNQGSNRLPPGSREGGEVGPIELVRKDEGSCRVGDGGANNQPRPLHFRQCATPSRCRRMSRLFVLDQPTSEHGRPPGVDPSPLVGSPAVDENVRGARAVEVGRVVNGELTGAPNEVLECRTKCSVVPHTSSNAPRVPGIRAVWCVGTPQPNYLPRFTRHRPPVPPGATAPNAGDRAGG